MFRKFRRCLVIFFGEVSFFWCFVWGGGASVWEMCLFDVHFFLTPFWWPFSERFF